MCSTTFLHWDVNKRHLIKDKNHMYRLEQHLADEFVSSLQTTQHPWGTLQTTTEFYYVRGRTDVVGLTLTNKIVAFEVKLKRWKDALHQAYRNTCFAHLSYIVV